MSQNLIGVKVINIRSLSLNVSIHNSGVLAVAHTIMREIVTTKKLVQY